MARLSIVFFMVVIPLIGFSQGINFSHQYHPNSEFKLDYKVVYNTNSTDILLKIASEDSLLSYNAILDFRNNYQTTISDSSATLYLSNALYSETDKTWLLDISFKKDINRRLLLLQFIHKQTGISYYFDIPLYWHPTINQSSTVLYHSDSQEAVMEQYLLANQQYQTDQTEMIRYYKNTFGAASPAMSMIITAPSEELSVDTTMLVKPNEKFSLQKEGMYFFENDTSNLHGSMYCVFNAPFPKYASFENLIAPLRYITTNNEYKQLIANPDKETFEKVFLSITKDAERAKQLIKSYFKQVEMANMMFTTYKEGWKTDMGMIFILFGNPNEVYKYDNKEEWIYSGTKQQSNLKFTFVKVDNVFSNRHYSLVRKKEYKTPWMNRVDLWRKGRINYN